MIAKRLKSIDMYGGELGLTFKGEGKYNTTCGGVCSLLTFTILLVCYGLITLKYVTGKDKQTTMIEEVYKDKQILNLYENGYRFAVNSMDSRFGRVEANLVIRDRDSGKKRVESIEMIPCN